MIKRFLNWGLPTAEEKTLATFALGAFILAMVMPWPLAIIPEVAAISACVVGLILSIIRLLKETNVH